MESAETISGDGCSDGSRGGGGRARRGTERSGAARRGEGEGLRSRARARSIMALGAGSWQRAVRDRAHEARRRRPVCGGAHLALRERRSSSGSRRGSGSRGPQNVFGLHEFMDANVAVVVVHAYAVEDLGAAANLRSHLNDDTVKPLALVPPVHRNALPDLRDGTGRCRGPSHATTTRRAPPAARGDGRARAMTPPERERPRPGVSLCWRQGSLSSVFPGSRSRVLLVRVVSRVTVLVYVQSLPRHSNSHTLSHVSARSRRARGQGA